MHHRPGAGQWRDLARIGYGSVCATKVGLCPLLCVEGPRVPQLRLIGFCIHRSGGVGLALGSSPKTGIAPVRKQSRVTVVGSSRPPSPLGMEYKAALPSTPCRYLPLVSSHSVATCFVDSSAPFSTWPLNGLSSRRPVIIGPILSFNPCSGPAGWSRAAVKTYPGAMEQLSLPLN